MTGTNGMIVRELHIKKKHRHTINSSDFYLQHLQILRWFALIGNMLISITFNILVYIAVITLISLKKMVWKDELFLFQVMQQAHQ